jgi:O-6-methylguanine DNA methyltransferase
MKPPFQIAIQVPLPTPHGDFIAYYSEKGLSALQFPSARTSEGPPSPEPVGAKVREWHSLTTQAVLSILAGNPPGPFPPLDLDSGTDFQRLVWRALLEIPPRETRSYGQVAAAIGHSKATRAVGAACGANPIPLLIPCHRVLAANHKIGGFSAGLYWKRLLLGREEARDRACRVH